MSDAEDLVAKMIERQIASNLKIELVIESQKKRLEAMIDDGPMSWHEHYQKEMLRQQIRFYEYGKSGTIPKEWLTCADQ